MNYFELKQLINSSNGKFFKVEFVKKDGTVRQMTCRIGVVSKLRGGVSTTSHKPNLITVFDVVKKEYRCINLDTLISYKCGEVVYQTEQSVVA